MKVSHYTCCNHAHHQPIDNKKNSQTESSWKQMKVSFGAAAFLAGASVAALAARYGLSQEAISQGVLKDAEMLQDSAQKLWDSSKGLDAFKFVSLCFTQTKEATLSVLSQMSQGIDQASQQISQGIDQASQQISQGFEAASSTIEGIEKVGVFQAIDQTVEISQAALNSAVCQIEDLASRIQAFICSEEIFN